MTATTRRIHVQNWATYNEGRLDGRWYDMDDYSDADELTEAIKAANRADAEEFFLADWEGFPKGLLTENTHAETAFEYSELLDDVDEDQITALYDAFGVHYFDSLPEAITALESRHRGTADTEKEFAEQWASETGMIPDHIPEGSLLRYVDYQWFWDGELQFAFATGRDDNNTLHFFTND
jgi:hypothetical protein